MHPPAVHAESRKFGLTVGLAFVALGTLSWWRGHAIAPRALWMLGVLLVVPGVFAPAVLAPVRRTWMAGATVLGNVNTRVILTVLFYVVLTPIGIVMRFFRDPVNRSLADAATSQWIKRASEPVDPARYQRQF